MTDSLVFEIPANANRITISVSQITAKDLLFYLNDKLVALPDVLWAGQITFCLIDESENLWTWGSVFFPSEFGAAESLCGNVTLGSALKNIKVCAGEGKLDSGIFKIILGCGR